MIPRVNCFYYEFKNDLQSADRGTFCQVSIRGEETQKRFPDSASESFCKLHMFGLIPLSDLQTETRGGNAAHQSLGIAVKIT